MISKKNIVKMNERGNIILYNLVYNKIERWNIISEKEIKELAEKLKKDFKKTDGGLQYSFQPMKYDKMFKEQAKKILKGK